MFFLQISAVAFILLLATSETAGWHSRTF